MEGRGEILGLFVYLCIVRSEYLQIIVLKKTAW